MLRCSQDVPYAARAMGAPRRLQLQSSIIALEEVLKKACLRTIWVHKLQGTLGCGAACRFSGWQQQVSIRSNGHSYANLPTNRQPAPIGCTQLHALRTMPDCAGQSPQRARDLWDLDGKRMKSLNAGVRLILWDSRLTRRVCPSQFISSEGDAARRGNGCEEFLIVAASAGLAISYAAALNSTQPTSEIQDSCWRYDSDGK